jgi:hypothetical protein
MQQWAMRLPGYVLHVTCYIHGYIPMPTGDGGWAFNPGNAGVLLPVHIRFFCRYQVACTSSTATANTEVQANWL